MVKEIIVYECSFCHTKCHHIETAQRCEERCLEQIERRDILELHIKNSDLPVVARDQLYKCIQAALAYGITLSD